tara:strand:+ start:9501 stop:9707 length:207 start_codon:yes stop_codon:yes gene_type:complete
MWKIYKYDGHYIQGEYISQHSSEAAALKKAKKEIKYFHSEKVNRGKKILIWLDSKTHIPLGVIVKKTR